MNKEIQKMIELAPTDADAIDEFDGTYYYLRKRDDMWFFKLDRTAIEWSAITGDVEPVGEFHIIPAREIVLNEMADTKYDEIIGLNLAITLDDVMDRMKIRHGEPKKTSEDILNKFYMLEYRRDADNIPKEHEVEVVHVVGDMCIFFDHKSRDTGIVKTKSLKPIDKKLKKINNVCKGWIDANVWDGDDRSGAKNDFIKSTPDELQELFEEYNEFLIEKGFLDLKES